MSGGSSHHVGDDLEAKNADWSFGRVSGERFQKHLRRSVPFYAEGHDLVCRLSDFFVRQDSTCYELGTSNGVLLEQLVRRHSVKPGTRWIGVDREKAMIASARERLDTCIDALVPQHEQGGVPDVRLVAEDASQLEFESTDFVVAYYTLQFMAPKSRQETVARIYEALNPGGAFLLFEKVRAPDARFQDIANALYTEYKLDQGFSPDEITAKARSLKGVLEPFSTAANLDLLGRAGFVDVVSVYKYICFEGFLAIK